MLQCNGFTERVKCLQLQIKIFWNLVFSETDHASVIEKKDGDSSWYETETLFFHKRVSV